jgi:hypothetical protein
VNPTVVLAWIQVVTEVGAVLAQLMELGNRVKAGEDVTTEELAALKQQTADAVARWNAAAPADKGATL